MWAGVVTGKNLHALARKEKHENTTDRDPGCAGCNCFGTNIHCAYWATKTGASNGHAATALTTPRGYGSGSASSSRREFVPDAQFPSACTIWDLGGKHVGWPQHSREMGGD